TFSKASTPLRWGVGPSFGFPRARKTVVFTRLSDCYSFHMDKRNLIGLFVIGIFADPLAVSAAISQNSNGWTDITPSRYTKIIYVSSSTGNDSTCAPASQPVNPAGVTPCKTIQRGKSFMRDGYPDWLLLKKGDTWTNEAIGDICINGRPGKEPALFSSSSRPAAAKPVLRPHGNAGPRATVSLASGLSFMPTHALRQIPCPLPQMQPVYLSACSSARRSPIFCLKATKSPSTARMS